MNFLGGATSLDSFLKAHQTSETKGFFHYEWFDHPDKMKNAELPRMMLSTVNFASATLSKMNPQTILTYWKVDWPQNKPLSYWNCQSHTQLELRIIITCNRYGSKNQWIRSRAFCGGITKKMLCQLWRQCKNLLPFTTTKTSSNWSLVAHYQTWLTFAYTNQSMQNFITSQREIKTYWKKFDKTSLVTHLSFLDAKQLLMKLYPKVFKHKQISWWDWWQSFIPLPDVPTYAHRSLYALGYRFRNQ